MGVCAYGCVWFGVCVHMGECMTLTWTSKNTLLFWQVYVCVCRHGHISVCGYVYVWANVHLCEQKCVCVYVLVGKSVCVGVRVHTWTNVCAMKKGLAGAYKDKVARAESFKLGWFLHLKKIRCRQRWFFFQKKLCSAENTKTTSFLKSCNELDVFNEYQAKPSDNFSHLDSSLTLQVNHFDLLVEATWYSAAKTMRALLAQLAFSFFNGNSSFRLHLRILPVVRMEPRTNGWEARTQPLCCAALQLLIRLKTNWLVLPSRPLKRSGRLKSCHQQAFKSRLSFLLRHLVYFQLWQQKFDIFYQLLVGTKMPSISLQSHHLSWISGLSSSAVCYWRFKVWWHHTSVHHSTKCLVI